MTFTALNKSWATEIEMTVIERLQQQVDIRGTASPFGALAADALAELEAALHSADFYKRRCDELQKHQSQMRDPERTIVCDILANGCILLPAFAGDRYKTHSA